MNYDDETLMAYADGELPDGQRAEIDAAIAADPALAKRVEKHRALRAEVAGAFAPVLKQPVPDKLVSAARGAASSPATASNRGNVVQFPSRGRAVPGAAWGAGQWFAMAASLLVGVLISWRVFSPQAGNAIVASNGAMVARGELANALNSQLASDQKRDGAVLVGLSFKSQSGEFCRSFTLRASNTAGLACKAGSDWQVPLTTTATVAGGQMQQANSELPTAVLQAIQSRISGELLGEKEEKDARDAGWNGKR